ncbi:hypothetical protein Dsin_029443 [Dipteronia sinensis]|uniref:RNase H type-1 domain-containing protein n=1 Tax=Dipteronia sinensis TaxID=43782 RepID=A0AAE0DWQ8_9ROSI|nr:hypothetical protein Dsin_029443 [Dipteronia sinensis]
MSMSTSSYRPLLNVDLINNHLKYLQTWFRRNDKVHESASFHDDDVVPSTMSYLSDFRKANTMKSKVSGERGMDTSRWIPHDRGRFKVNTDDAIDAESGNAGVGIIIRDSYGEVLASSSQSVGARYSPQIVEALALPRGLLFARETGIWPCLIESDAQTVYDIYSVTLDFNIL